MFVLLRAVGVGDFGVDGIAAAELDPAKAKEVLAYVRAFQSIQGTYPNVLTFFCSGGFVPCMYLDEETAQEEASLGFYERLSGSEDYILLERLPAGLEEVDRAYALHIDSDTLRWVGETWETESLPLAVIAQIAGETTEE
ncbi:MAG: hypothetical protein QW260_06170 [Thermoproteota archaeon]